MFTFMHKYNELILEGLNKLCKGCSDYFAKDSHNKSQSGDDSSDF